MNPDTPGQQGSSSPPSRQRCVAWKRYVPILLTLVVGVSFSFFLREKAIDNQKHHLRHVFESITNNYSLLIMNSIKSRFQALESIRSFYYSSKTVDRDEFASFVALYFNDRDDFHGVLWVPLAAGAQPMQFEQATIAGCDLASDPVLLSAMNKSRQTGQIAVSERVQLPGGTETQYGVYIFVPVYDKDAVGQADTNSPCLQGFIAGILHVDALVQSALDIADIQPISIHVYDDEAPAGKKVLYSHCSLPNRQCDMSWRRFLSGERGDMQHRTQYLAGQRKWTISFEPCKDFFSPYRTYQSLLILVAGLLVTVLTALCFLMRIGRTLRIERLVAERTQQLRTANDSLEAEIAEGQRIQVEKERLLSLLSVANDELIESNDKLSRSNHELEDFAYVASHDLQEPLRKVTAFGDRLKAGYSDVLDETGRDYVERMQNAARRMSILINDLLTYSRVSSKAQPFAEVDLEETVREVLEDLEVHIEELNATVQVGPLPCVQADAIQMRQLMQNLISNALKFHKSDTPPAVKIYSRPLDEDATEATASGSAVEIVVEDNGIGFDEKHADQIFRMFQRLHGRSEYEGTGVGLAVCRKIAERHGIAITAKGTAGVGARFALTFASGSVLSQSTVTNCKGLRNV